ncbi:hypothetical protein ANO11243_050420 [Dothideomycetidae sp. 11243]|nr:hypothetical protein ANO11243_050420 [fungal sp. No.11243]
MATINMNVSGPFPSLCSDDSIGPVLQNPACRDHGFDFTLLFEETAFAIIPAVLLLCAAPLRFRSIYRRPDAVRWPPLCRIKLANIAILGLLDLTLLALWALPRYAALRTRTTIAATALDLAAVIVIGGLSPLEHSKSLRPSTILSVYLFFTTILDVARARTEWLLSTSSAIPAVFTTALAAKVSLLVLEGMTKAGHTDRIISPETTSSIYGLSSFAWLNPLIYLGSKTNLTEQSLYPIDDKISSKLIQAKLNKQWKSGHLQVSKQSENALAWAILRALRIPIAVTMIPRLALIGFSIAQPFLIQRAIVFVEVGTTPVRYGYGLIGAFGVTYLGIAVSTAWYEYLTARALAMIRASLIGIIYQSTLDMTTEAVQTASPVSLMGADVERVIARLRWVISTAPNILQVAIAIWLLGTHLGPVCIAPVLVVLILAYLSSKVGKTIRPRQQRWMQAVRKRVAMTTDVLGTTKGMKMLGFTTLITDLVQSARHYELDESKKFRSVQIVNITLGNAANMLSPVVTLIGYGIIVHYSSDKVPTATTIFSSLSLLSILMGPVDELVAAVPNLAMALESCTRIQQYVDVKKRLDFRTASLERADRRVESHLRPSASGRDTIHIEAVTAGWSTDKTVIHDLTIQMSAGTLTIVVGPSGSGKSTLLQVLLGEGIVQNGTVALTSHDIAYCDQTPFLTNRSIRDNVVGFRDFDEAWYHACLSACAIDTDIEHLLHGDETLVGSKGVALSGGQKQRLVWEPNPQ